MKVESKAFEQLRITEQELPSILTKIGDEREKPGVSDKLIPHIRAVRKEVERQGNPSIVIQLFQEEYLVAQHLVMEEVAKGLKTNPFKIIKGILIMESTLEEMKRRASKEDQDLDPVIKTRVFRFLGKDAERKRDYKKSEQYYKKGLEYFESLTEPEKRFNRLEFLGFLSYSQLKQGKTDEGLSLVRKTLEEFDGSEEGAWLKENNYYAWIVWKSGIEIRTAGHLYKTKNPKYTSQAQSLLTDAEEMLKPKEESKYDFSLRLAELRTVKGLI